MQDSVTYKPDEVRQIPVAAIARFKKSFQDRLYVATEGTTMEYFFRNYEHYVRSKGARDALETLLPEIMNLLGEEQKIEHPS